MENTTKHTQGPWHTPDLNGRPLVRVFSRDGYQVADCTHLNITHRPAAVCEANARLIASAPELLEVLEFIAGHCRMARNNYCDTKDHTIKCRGQSLENIERRALEVIAKATGKGV